MGYSPNYFLFLPCLRNQNFPSAKRSVLFILYRLGDSNPSLPKSVRLVLTLSSRPPICPITHFPPDLPKQAGGIGGERGRPPTPPFSEACREAGDFGGQISDPPFSQTPPFAPTPHLPDYPFFPDPLKQTGEIGGGEEGQPVEKSAAPPPTLLPLSFSEK